MEIFMKIVWCANCDVGPHDQKSFVIKKIKNAIFSFCFR